MSYCVDHISLGCIRAISAVGYIEIHITTGGSNFPTVKFTPNGMCSLKKLNLWYHGWLNFVWKLYFYKTRFSNSGVVLKSERKWKTNDAKSSVSIQTTHWVWILKLEIRSTLGCIQCFQFRFYRSLCGSTETPILIDLAYFLSPSVSCHSVRLSTIRDPSYHVTQTTIGKHRVKMWKWSVTLLDI